MAWDLNLSSRVTRFIAMNRELIYLFYVNKCSTSVANCDRSFWNTWRAKYVHNDVLFATGFSRSMINTVKSIVRCICLRFRMGISLWSAEVVPKFLSLRQSSSAVMTVFFFLGSLEPWVELTCFLSQSSTWFEFYPAYSDPPGFPEKCENSRLDFLDWSNHAHQIDLQVYLIRCSDLDLRLYFWT